MSAAERGSSKILDENVVVPSQPVQADDMDRVRLSSMEIELSSTDLAWIGILEFGTAFEVDSRLSGAAFSAPFLWMRSRLV